MIIRRTKHALLVALIGLLLIIVLDIAIHRWRTPSIIENLLKANACEIETDKIDADKLYALIQVEDPTFYENNGWDFNSPGAGFTTISQSIGKQIYFEDFKPGIRKIRLLYLTRFALVPVISKKEILTVFMNYAYLGNHEGIEIYGFENASKTYYQKSFYDLSKDEFLSLLAMLISPNEFHVIRQPNKNMERVKRMKNLLLGKGKPLDWNDVELEGCK